MRIEQEAGFDAWLITREKQEATAGSKGNQRQTFGKLGKQKEEEEEEDSKKRSRASDEEEPDFESEDEKQSKGFIKPGSSKSKKDEASPSGNKKVKHGKKDQDKVVFARKRGGKQGISGGR